MTERKFGEREVQLARYRLLKREVTDPLAACLLHVIIEELEADVARGSAGEDPRSCKEGGPSKIDAAKHDYRTKNTT